MKKPEFLSAVRNGHKEFLKSFEGMSHDSMVEPGVVGNWSVKDTVSHVSMWKAEAIRVLYYVEQDDKPPKIYAGKDIDQINDEWYQNTVSRTVEQVMADYQGVSKQLLKRLEDLPDDHWENPEGSVQISGELVTTFIADNSFDHEAEHAAEIRKWRERCK
ncbi:MAG: DinB family protein [Chloroflexi bacterium]|nr:MAG: DinB family protein [Chloroflexota bacterium]